MYTYVATALIAALLAFGAGWQTQGWRWRAADADRLEVAREQARANRATERQQSTNVQEAVNASRKREILARADAVGARDALYSLRGAIAIPARPAGFADGTCAVTADPARELLGVCAQALTDLADKADRHAGDALMLQQAWPK